MDYFVDIEVLADRWEEEQKVIEELNKEEPNMLDIVFEYRDRYTNGKWNQQSCRVSSVEECKRIYGLGVDCEYRFILIKKVGE